MKHTGRWILAGLTLSLILSSLNSLLTLICPQDQPSRIRGSCNPLCWQLLARAGCKFEKQKWRLLSDCPFQHKQSFVKWDRQGDCHWGKFQIMKLNGFVNRVGWCLRKYTKLNLVCLITHAHKRKGIGKLSIAMTASWMFVLPDLPVGEYLRANETFSSFLVTNGSLPRPALDVLLRARLNFQVVSVLSSAAVWDYPLLTSAQSLMTNHHESCLFSLITPGFMGKLLFILCINYIQITHI